MPGRVVPRSVAVVVVIGAGVLLALWSARSKTARRAPDEGAAPNETVARDLAGERDARGAGGPGGARVTHALSRADVEALAEGQMMAQLRKLAETDPEATIRLARQGSRRFPDSADAPERTSILIHALAAVGRSSEARGEAEEMVNHYADSSWVREVERFTGAHRHRDAYLTDAGTVEYR